MANRNIGEVLDQMLAIATLPPLGKEQLDKFVNALRYKAPEQLNSCWGALGNLCSSMVERKPPEQLRGWEKELIEILMNNKL